MNVQMNEQMDGQATQMQYAPPTSSKLGPPTSKLGA